VVKALDFVVITIMSKGLNLLGFKQLIGATFLVKSRLTTNCEGPIIMYLNVTGTSLMESMFILTMLVVRCLRLSSTMLTGMRRSWSVA